MHLKQLKLSGFKSFVDPTIVPLPSQLVAVVGPNGCGKSNVIDALRWALGESSAKNLRGESMVDVIFNGSSTRKAVGQASVELIFDNSMGRLTGQYASYQEISVKRLVTRDGTSSYFLNGTRCLRRDITDIFLGTGAGAHGYSIIGQGTISRLVEARPEELRGFLEEAAGISKYKERRRDTLSRIHHTRENLARIADIRAELDKQLQRLERQARSAERYQLLKEEERSFKAEILALKCQALRKEQATIEEELTRHTLSYEAHQAKATDAYKQCTILREKIQAENDGLQNLQANFYQLATDIALLEESIQQNLREKQRLITDEQQVQNDWQIVSAQVQEETHLLQKSEASFKETTAKLELMRLELAEKQQSFQAIQHQQTRWQEQWNEVQKLLANATKEAEVAELGLTHSKQRQQDTQLRVEKIQQELQQLNERLLKDTSIELQTNLSLVEVALEQEEENCAAHRSLIEDSRSQLADTETRLHQEQDGFHRLKAEEAALTAMLNAAMDQIEEDKSPQASDYPRLVEVMAVDGEWQRACEFVLGANLKARVVDSISPLCSDAEVQTLGGGVYTACLDAKDDTSPYPRLSDKIQGVKPSFHPTFDKIFAAKDLNEACAWLPTIKDDESIITPERCWIGKRWMQLAGSDRKEGISLLATQQQLRVLKDALRAADASVSHLKLKRDELFTAMKTNETILAGVQNSLSEKRENVRIFKASISEQERSLQQLTASKRRFADELDTLYLRLEDLIIQMDKINESLCMANATQAKAQETQSALLADKAHWETGLSASRQSMDDTHAALYQLELQGEREHLLIKQASNNIVRDEVRLLTLTDRLEALALQRIALETPDTSRDSLLNEKLSAHSELETTLTKRREALSLLTLEMNARDAEVKTEEKHAKTVGDTLQSQQLALQTLKVHANNLLESLTELGAQVDVLLTEIPGDVTLPMREASLLETVEKIKRLGAINLAAIEEFETEFQRKQYLDEQYNDLTEALNTLDIAIEKMDKETRQRLEQTFDEVNRAFQSLFPRLFGGGRAMLELTCDNVLEAGILIMAQPPGKRNSTIHLLSGGEKAMTAVALVFAIFQLNPSPFCMLDEVDAPLDDVNVGRFCTLVKEMSQFVQFLFITHNKVTMELADHLIGVTMREPGVSRVVAVDVEQALAMTES
ncbi:MAG: chromosome segregation protein SMC [Legionella sp.]|nr:chromosome segregation protein SMC [Legionella sp.]